MEDFPHSHTLALEYSSHDDDENYDRDCQDLRCLTKPLISIINLDREVTPREGEKLLLEFVHEFGGIVRMISARLVQAAKRVKSDDSNSRERAIRFSEVRVGGLTDEVIQALSDDENLMEDTDTKERLREETKNRYDGPLAFSSPLLISTLTFCNGVKFQFKPSGHLGIWVVSWCISCGHIRK